MKDKKKLLIALPIAFGAMFGTEYLLSNMGKSDESPAPTQTQSTTQPTTEVSQPSETTVQDVQGATTTAPTTQQKKTTNGSTTTQNQPTTQQPTTQTNTSNNSNNQSSRNDSNNNTIIDEEVEQNQRLKKTNKLTIIRT